MIFYKLLGPIVLALLVGACTNLDWATSPANDLEPLVIQESPAADPPTATATNTATPTSIPPTAQATATPIATSTFTPSPTSRPSITPTTGPRLLLPDLYTLPPSNLSIEVHYALPKRLLRFSNSIANQGPGTLELWGENDQATGKTTVTQRIYTDAGTFHGLEVGEFIFHPQHDHWHFVNFARYELWTLSSYGGPVSTVGLTGKVSYCLRDTFRIHSSRPASGPAYLACESKKQGISAGWVDRYRSTLPGQVIDITSLPSYGVYALVSTVDPENRLLETNETNNAARIYIEIDGSHVRIINRADIPAIPPGLNPPED
jgi:hypothetical protein